MDDFEKWFELLKVSYEELNRFLKTGKGDLDKARENVALVLLDLED